MPDNYEFEFGLDPFRTEDGGYDNDGDQLVNSQEYANNTFFDLPDSDFDGILDNNDLWPRDAGKALDSDSDGISDAEEIAAGDDPMSPRPADEDRDADGLTYLAELALGTSDTNRDSDNDGVDDDADRFPLLTRYSQDSDMDGLPDAYEVEVSFSDPYYAWDAANDSDGDGLTTRQEFALQSDPQNPDSDGDGTFDGGDPAPLNPDYQRDEDNDGLPDAWEIAQGLDPTYPDAHMDEDGDRLSNEAEFRIGTSATIADTDGDGIYDLADRFPTDVAYSMDLDRDGMPTQWEAEHGFSDAYPLDRNADDDGDGYSNFQEYAAQTNPLIADDQWRASGVETISSGNLSNYDYNEESAEHRLSAEGQAFGQWVDNISFAFQAISGDVDIQVRLASIENDYASGGIMLRSTMDFGSPRAANIIEKQVGIAVHTRQEAYTPFPSVTFAGPGPGSWLRLVKKGDEISSYISSDGQAWGLLASQHLKLGDTFFVGLAGTTNEISATNEIVYDSMQVFRR